MVLYDANIKFKDGKTVAFCVDEYEKQSIMKGFIEAKNEDKAKVLMVEENKEANLGMVLIDLSTVSCIEFSSSYETEG